MIAVLLPCRSFARKNTMVKTVLKFGALSGGIAAVLMLLTMGLLSKYIGFNWGLVVGYASIIITFSVIYPALNTYKQKEGKGTISFGKALAIGLLISLIGSICYVIAWAFVYRYMMPDYLDKFIEKSIASMKSSGATETAIQKQTTEMNNYREAYKSPLYFFLYTISEPLPVGVLMSLILAFVVSRKKKKVVEA